MKSTRQNRGFGRKVKKCFIVLFIVFILTGLVLNSNQFTEYKDNAYSKLRKEYLNETEVTANNKPEIVEDVVEKAEPKKVRNLELTLDSDLRVPSNLTAQEIDKMLEGTKLYGLGATFEKAEKEYNVNSLYLIGLAALESGWGTSKYAIERNNLYGWNAIDSNPDLATTFSSREEATLFVASKLKANYLTKGAPYFEGYTPRSIDVHYCTDKLHANKIINITSSLTKKLG